MSDDLELLRIKTSKLFQPFMWVHVGLLPVIAYFSGNNWVEPTSYGFCMALVATLIWLKDPASIATRLVSAVAFIGIISIFVYLLRGTFVQVDMHMYYFAALAILATYCDWMVIVAATAAIACHHLILNFILPDAVYPGGSNFSRVLMHAVIALIEAGILILLSLQLTRFFAEAAQNISVMEGAREKEARLNIERETLRVKTEAEKKDAMVRLADDVEHSINGIVSSVVNATAQMQASSEGLSFIANSASEKVSSVVAGAELANTNVRAVVAATEELSSSIGDISERIGTVSKQTDQARLQADKTSKTMQILSTNAEKIGSVVELVQQIAGQTNLLALNATIEAARAGDAGKGFAVVASEVKSLANQTAKATEEISSQIVSIQQETDNARSEIAAISGSVSQINSLMEDLLVAVEQQRASTQQISRSVSEVSRETEGVSVNTAGLGASSSETGEMAKEALGISSELSRQVDQLKKEFSAFIKRIRVH